MTNKSATAQELRNTTADPVSDSPTPASAADPLGICPGCGMPNDHDMYRCVQNHIERTRGMVASPQPHQQDLPPDSPVSAGMASAADPLGICPGYVIVPIDKLEFVCRLLDANQCQNTAKELRTMLATAIESAAAQDETPQVEKCKEPVPAAAHYEDINSKAQRLEFEIEKIEKELAAANARIELLEHDAKSGSYETLYAQTVMELQTANAEIKRLRENVIPMVKRATGRTIPDLTKREHICEWQSAIHFKETT